MADVIKDFMNYFELNKEEITYYLELLPASPSTYLLIKNYSYKCLTSPSSAPDSP